MILHVFIEACEILHVEEIYKRKKNLICLIKKGGFYLTEEEKKSQEKIKSYLVWLKERRKIHI